MSSARLKMEQISENYSEMSNKVGDINNLNIMFHQRLGATAYTSVHMKNNSVTYAPTRSIYNTTKTQQKFSRIG